MTNIQIGTRQLVEMACDDMAEQGVSPTVEKVRARIGRGSATTISDQLRKWRQRQDGKQQIENDHLPDFLVKANRAILEQAELAAMEKFAGEREGYVGEIVSLRHTLEMVNEANNALQMEITSLRNQIEARNNELDSLSQSNDHLRSVYSHLSDDLDRTRNDLSVKDILLQNTIETYRIASEAGEDRLRGMERTMLLEIDKARQSVKEVQKHAEQKIADGQMELDIRARRMLDETSMLRKKVADLTSEKDHLAGMLEASRKPEVSPRKFHRSVARQAVQSFKRKGRRTDK